MYDAGQLSSYLQSNSTWRLESPWSDYLASYLLIAGGGALSQWLDLSLLRRIAMTNLDSVLKSRDITLPTKVHLVKALIFPVVMYECESWTIKKAEHQRIGTFKLWCWRRLLRVPSTARRSNQSILKEINPEYSLEGLMLKLKLQYFGHLMWRPNSLVKIEGKKRRGNRGWDGWMASLAQWKWVWANSRRWWWTGKPGVLRFMGLQRVGRDAATEQQHSRSTKLCQSQAMIQLYIYICSFSYAFPLFFPYFVPCSLLQNIKCSSLCYTVGSCWLSILCIVVSICQSQAPNLSLLLVPHLVTTCLFSVSVGLFLFCIWVKLYHPFFF